MKIVSLLCATTALVLPSMAFAQSTGSIDFDEKEIVVTGSRLDNGVGGVVAPDTSKAKAVLTDEFIQRQVPGQSINEIINQLPGVSFQNNDPFGSAGGTLTIRGFDDTRISQTFDGVPLNDSGNYALYSSQQLDPELIEQVNVNLGSTDVDSPTAAASGSTVNYRTRLPRREFGYRLQGSIGEFDFRRLFGAIDTGEFTSFGTRAFIAASHSENDNVYNNRGKVNKDQYNGRIYQPLGANGDFVSVAAHYNESRNNFFGSVPLRIDTAGNRVVPNRFPLTGDERYYTIARCTTNTVERPGIADVANSCGSTFDERTNPSNTGNVRANSRFTLADGLVLAVDPSFQYVKANGGGTAVAQEGLRDVNATGGNANCLTTPNSATVSCQSGYIGGTPYFGRDLNGDGDIRDTVRIVTPSQTQTRRYGLIASLRYEINDQHTVRAAYSYDRARHRQTGETGYLDQNGEPLDVFPINRPLADVNGNVLQKRDRLSYAILNQVSGEYRGEFFDERLVLQAGVRAPFFTRDLTNFCATSNPAGFVECFGTNSAGAAAYAAANSTIQGPQQRILKYDAILPNIGFVFDVMPRASIFGNFSKGLQVPGTDNLYNSFFFAPDRAEAQPRPETTQNFDLGARYRSTQVQAQITGWFTKYQDRLASAYDPELDRSVYRNLGTVHKAGVDGSISYRPVPNLMLYAFGSYMESEIQDDLLTGETTGGVQIFAPTRGKRESGAPVYTLGGRVQGTLGPLDLGVQAKRTGPRYVNDQNLPITVGGVDVYPSKVPAYTLVDLDARLSLAAFGLSERNWIQLNVSNLFDTRYVGGFDGGFSNTSIPFVQIGAPRTFIGTLVVGM